MQGKPSRLKRTKGAVWRRKKWKRQSLCRQWDRKDTIQTSISQIKTDLVLGLCKGNRGLQLVKES